LKKSEKQQSQPYFIVLGPYRCDGPGTYNGSRSVERFGKAASDAAELSRDGGNGLHGQCRVGPSAG